MEWLFVSCIFRNLWQYKVLPNELHSRTGKKSYKKYDLAGGLVPKIVVIIFHEMEKDILRKGGIANVCEKVVNWHGRFACDDCGCNNSRLTSVYLPNPSIVTQPIESVNSN